MGNGFSRIPDSMSLREVWQKVANNNRSGDPNTIDNDEQMLTYGSIYFIEEGMTEQEFYDKNKEIHLKKPFFKDGHILNYVANQKEALSSAVSNVVNQMIDNGEFETKKEIVLGKINYMNEETQKRVLDLLPETERQEVQQKIDDFK